MGPQRIGQLLLQLRIERHERPRLGDEPGLDAVANYFINF